MPAVRPRHHVILATIASLAVTTSTASTATSKYCDNEYDSKVMLRGMLCIAGRDPESLNRQTLDERRKQAQAVAREQSKPGEGNQGGPLPNGKSSILSLSKQDKPSPERAPGAGATTPVLSSKSARAAGSHDRTAKGGNTGGSENRGGTGSSANEAASGQGDSAVRSKALALLSGSSSGRSPSKAAAEPPGKEVTSAQAVPGKKRPRTADRAPGLAEPLVA